MKKLLLLFLSLALCGDIALAQGNSKKMRHRKGRHHYTWTTDPDGRKWRTDRNGNKIWRTDKRVKRNVNRGGNLNNGDNGDRNNSRGRGDSNNR